MHILFLFIVCLSVWLLVCSGCVLMSCVWVVVRVCGLFVDVRMCVCLYACVLVCPLCLVVGLHVRVC